MSVMHGESKTPHNIFKSASRAARGEGSFIGSGTEAKDLLTGSVMSLGEDAEDDDDDDDGVPDILRQGNEHYGAGESKNF